VSLLEVLVTVVAMVITHRNVLFRWIE